MVGLRRRFHHMQLSGQDTAYGVSWTRHILRRNAVFRVTQRPPADTIVG